MADDLGDVADQGLAAVQDEGHAEQGMFENTDYTKIKFLGVSYDSLELDPKIGDEFVFTVRGRITEVGDKQLKDGHIQHIGKVDVSSVTLHEEG